MPVERHEEEDRGAIDLDRWIAAVRRIQQREGYRPAIALVDHDVTDIGEPGHGLDQADRELAGGGHNRLDVDPGPVRLERRDHIASGCDAGDGRS